MSWTIYIDKDGLEMDLAWALFKVFELAHKLSYGLEWAFSKCREAHVNITLSHIH